MIHNEKNNITLTSLTSRWVIRRRGIPRANRLHCTGYNTDTGLYRDYGLAILRNITPSHHLHLQTNLTKIYITTDSTINMFNLLFITLNLNDGIYRTCQKPNTTTQTTTTWTDCPIILIQQRKQFHIKPTDDYPTCPEMWSSSKPRHAIKSAGYTHQLEFQKANKSQKIKKRKPNII